MKLGSFDSQSDVLEFLRNSNNIENVWDDDSLMQAWYAWEYCMSKEELVPTILLQVHHILMLNQPSLESNQKGFFRQQPVWIGGREAPHYSEIKPGIMAWLKFMNNKETQNDFQTAHVMYEGVHPFVDGNGRTGRIFMNFHRRAMKQPLLIIEADKKQSYYDWFRE